MSSWQMTHNPPSPRESPLSTPSNARHQDDNPRHLQHSLRSHPPKYCCSRCAGLYDRLFLSGFLLTRLSQTMRILRRALSDNFLLIFPCNHRISPITEYLQSQNICNQRISAITGYLQLHDICNHRIPAITEYLQSQNICNHRMSAITEYRQSQNICNYRISAITEYHRNHTMRIVDRI